MKAVHPYLNLPGNTEEAFTFYKSVFGGEFAGLVRFGDFPDNPMGIAEADLHKIANIALPIGPNTLLMATDWVDSFPDEFKPGNNVYITLDPDTAEEATSLFDQLSAGGEVEMPLQKTEWAEAYGTCADRFGVKWMINYEGDVKFG